jgi:hypothetical protein
LLRWHYADFAVAPVPAVSSARNYSKARIGVTS